MTADPPTDPGHAPASGQIGDDTSETPDAPQASAPAPVSVQPPGRHRLGGTPMTATAARLLAVALCCTGVPALILVADRPLPLPVTAPAATPSPAGPTPLVTDPPTPVAIAQPSPSPVSTVRPTTTAAATPAMATKAAPTAPPMAIPPPKAPPLVIGAVPYWDTRESNQTLSSNDESLTTVTPWYFGLSADGAVESAVSAAETDRVMARLRATGVPIVPTVADTTDGAWAPAVVQAIIRDDDRRRRHVAELVELTVSDGFAGLQLDYEDLAGADREAFTSLVTELADGLHAENKVLYVTVHPKTSDAGYDERNRAQDYAAIGEVADRVVVMAYDWHWSASTPGPIAPMPWVEDVVAYTLTQVPARKVVLGIGLYGYDWASGSGDAAADIVWGEADDLADRHGVTPGWDAKSGSPYLQYRTDGQDHEVWYENARSIAPKLELARRSGLGGVELWRLGAEDPALWELLAPHGSRAS